MICLLVGLALVGCQEKKKVFKIPSGHVGMFGYGSLTSKKFIETGLLKSNYSGPYLPAHLNGYQRSWTFAWPTDIPSPYHDGKYYKDFVLVNGDSIFPKYLYYLNIRKTANSIVNGVLYVVPEADLPTYDGWELGYERIDVSEDITDYVIEGGPVFAYKALPDFDKDPVSDYAVNIIEQGYSEIIQEAFDYWGKEFEVTFRSSTAPFDSTIIKANQKVIWLNPPLQRTEELRVKFSYPGH